MVTHSPSGRSHGPDHLGASRHDLILEIFVCQHAKFFHPARWSDCRCIHDTPTETKATETKATETMAAFKTTEFVVYLIAVAGVLIASNLVGEVDGRGDVLPGRQGVALRHPPHDRLPAQSRAGEARQPATTTTAEEQYVEPAITELARTRFGGEICSGDGTRQPATYETPHNVRAIARR